MSSIDYLRQSFRQLSRTYDLPMKLMQYPWTQDLVVTHIQMSVLSDYTCGVFRATIIGLVLVLVVYVITFYLRLPFTLETVSNVLMIRDSENMTKTLDTHLRRQ